MSRQKSHWQVHGATQVATPRKGAIGHFTECTLAAHSVADPRLMGGTPHVLLEVGREPFTCAPRLTPDAALALADALVQAAHKVQALAGAAKGGA